MARLFVFLDLNISEISYVYWNVYIAKMEHTRIAVYIEHYSVQNYG